MKCAFKKFVYNFPYVVCVDFNFCIQVTAARNFFLKKPCICAYPLWWYCNKAWVKNVTVNLKIIMQDKPIWNQFFSAEYNKQFLNEWVKFMWLYQLPKFCVTRWEVVTVKILPAFLGNGRKQITFVKIHNTSSFFIAKNISMLWL